MSPRSSSPDLPAGTCALPHLQPKGLLHTLAQPSAPFRRRDSGPVRGASPGASSQSTSISVTGWSTTFSTSQARSVTTPPPRGTLDLVGSQPPAAIQTPSLHQTQAGSESIVQGPPIEAEEAIATQIYPGITMDPSVRFGKPCIAGTRIDVATVVGAVGADDSLEAVQEAYGLNRDQVLAAVRYAAHVAAHLPPAVREVS